MSFYINNNNKCRPGPMNGNPTSGICEKALIEVKKVFDACQSFTTETGLALTLANFTPAGPTLPLTYISAEMPTTQSATLSNVVIDRIESRPNFANVSATVTVPVVVTYRDANGVEGTATSTITLQKCAILFVPQPAATPVNIEAFASFSSSIGTINEAGTIATVTGCLLIVLKVTAIVDLLVPSYGYPTICACTECQGFACPGLNELPLFPTANTN